MQQQACVCVYVYLCVYIYIYMQIDTHLTVMLTTMSLCTYLLTYMSGLCVLLLLLPVCNELQL